MPGLLVLIYKYAGTCQSHFCCKIRGQIEGQNWGNVEVNYFQRYSSAVIV